MPDKKKNADELIEEIGAMETKDEVQAAAEGDDRVTVQKAAEARIEELAGATDSPEDPEEPAKTVEVQASLLSEVYTAVTHKVNADKKFRGMSQPSTVDRELARVKEELEKII